MSRASCWWFGAGAVVLAQCLMLIPLWVSYKSTVENRLRVHGNLEDPSVVTGDFTTYLHATLSLLQWDIERKLNDKHIPDLPQQGRLTGEQMPSWSIGALALYPYPAAKPGYALTSAILTAPWPQSWFEQKVDRLTFANALLLFATALLSYGLGVQLTGSIAGGLVCGLFTAADVANTHNALFYKSHTACGLFYVFLALRLLFYWANLTPLRVGVLSFVLSMSVMSSTHSVIFSITLNGLILLSACLNQANRTRLKTCIAAFIGGTIYPLYLQTVEDILIFNRKGLPTMKSLWRAYAQTVYDHMGAQPWDLNFIWDFRVFNIFALGLACLGVWALWRTKGVWREERGRLAMIAIAMALFQLRAAFYSHAISRASAPFTMLYGLALAVILGRAWNLTNRLGKLVIAFATAVTLSNYLFIFGVWSWPSERSPGSYVTINEDQAISESVAQFSQDPNVRPIPFRFYNRRLEEFVSLDLCRQNNFVQFDPMDIVKTYASIHRLSFPGMPFEGLRVQREDFERDFRLLLDLVDRRDAVVERPRVAWPIAFWDTELNYMFGYSRRVLAFMGESKLTRWDPRSVYYIDCSRLKATTQSGGAAKPPRLVVTN